MHLEKYFRQRSSWRLIQEILVVALMAWHGLFFPVLPIMLSGARGQQPLDLSGEMQRVASREFIDGLAQAAVEELSDRLPGGPSVEVRHAVREWQDLVEEASGASVRAAEFRRLLQPFYDAIRKSGVWLAYPWAEDMTVAEEYFPVTEIQAEAAFRFDWDQLAAQRKAAQKWDESEVSPTKSAETLRRSLPENPGPALQKLIPNIAPGREVSPSEMDVLLASPSGSLARDSSLSSQMAAAVAAPNAVGHTPGEAGVEQGGAATYRVPIVVTPGSGGMQPKLALAYSSRGGRSHFGQGWGLAGLSAITRAPATAAQDGGLIGGVSFEPVTSANRDRYALDGRRLMVLNGGDDGADGAEYRTEIQSFVKVISYGSAGHGPESFKAWTKDGLLYTYGGTGDSRLPASHLINSANPTSAKGTILSWAVSRIEDNAGNYMTFTYDRDTANGEQWVTAIDYTGNTRVQPNLGTYANVAFAYEARSGDDISRGYTAGAITSLTKRLKTVTNTVLVNGAPEEVRKYTLTYDRTTATRRNRLVSIQESADHLILPATNFGYESTDARLTKEMDRHNLGTAATSYFFRAGDFNGDGRADLLKINEEGGDATLRVTLSLSNGSGLGNLGVWSSGAVRFDPIDAWVPGDFDTDGRLDVLRISSSNSLAKLDFLRNTGSAAFTPASYPTTTARFERHSVVLPADYNGDGKLDVAIVTGTDQGGSEGTAIVNVMINTGSGFAAQQWFPAGLENRKGDWYVADYTGDGLPDLARVFEDGNSNAAITVLTNTGRGSSGPGTLFAHLRWNTPVLAFGNRYWQQGDFNGDGLADFMCVPYQVNGSTQRIDASSTIRVFLSTGVAFLQQDWGMPAAAEDSIACRAGDFNGDGRADFAVVTWTEERKQVGVTGPGGAPIYDYAYSHSVQPYYSDGSRFYAGTKESYGPTAYSSARETNFDWLAADLAGSGREEIGRMYVLGGDCRLDLWRPPQTIPDLMTAIRDGMGKGTTFSYLPLTDANVYTKDATVPAGIVSVMMPIPVVSVARHNFGNDPDAYYRIDYRYGGLRASPTRGFLGFRYMVALDGRNGTEVVNFFEQTFPYIGQTNRSLLRQGAMVLSDTTVTFDHKLRHGNRVYFPYARTSEVKKYEPGSGGATVSILTTRTTYSDDDFSNATAVRVEGFVDGSWRETTSVYANDPATWRIGRVLSSEATGWSPQQVTPARVRKASFTYDTAAGGTGQVASEEVEPAEANRVKTDHLYDAFGNVIKTTVSGPGLDPRITENVYDARGRFIETVKRHGTVSATVPDGILSETRQYDQRFATPTRITDVNGLVTQIGYDDLGRKISEDGPDAADSTDSYEWYTGSAIAARYFVTETTAGAPTTTTYFDRLGREVQRETVGPTGQNVITARAYDQLGREAWVTRPYFPGGAVLKMLKSYDVLGRPIRIETPKDGGGVSVTTYAYTFTTATELAATTITDALGHSTTSYTNSRNQLVQVVDAVQGSTTYGYDGDGNIARYTDAYGNETNITFDSRGQKTAMSDPDMGAWSYQYNAVGEIIQQTDARGNVAYMTYDRLGRMVDRREVEGKTVWVYDTALGAAKGKLHKVLTISNPGYDGTNQEFTYDSLGRPIKEVRTTNGVSGSITTETTYDSFSRVDTARYPSLTIKNVYDANGYLKEIRKGTATGPLYWKATQFDADGHVTGEQVANGTITTSRVYAPATGLLRQVDSPVQTLRYAWDEVGNLTERDDQRLSVRETFIYDHVNRLTSSTVVGGPTVSLTYDRLGNIRSKTGIGDYLYPLNAQGQSARHRPGQVGGSVQTYDNNGNLTSGSGRTYQWTSYNLPREITRGDTQTRFIYDGARGRSVQEQWQNTGGTWSRVKRTVVVANYERIEEGATTKHRVYVDGVAVVTLVQQLGQSDAEYTRWLHSDHLGSVSVVTNESGAVLERMSYDAWGARRNLNGTNVALGGAWTGLSSAWSQRGFTGHEMLEELGIIHMKGRVYNPEQGQFTSADSYVQDATVPGMFNRYSYVLNRPLSATDPSGHFIDILVGIIVGALATYGTGTALGTALGVTIWGAGATLTWTTLAVAVVAGAVGGFAGAFASTLVAGGTVGQAFQAGLSGALWGGISAGLAYGIGHFAAPALNGTLFGGTKIGLELTRGIGHAVVGGVLSEAQGGDFLSGALSSAAAVSVGFASQEWITNTEMPGILGRTALAAIAGGTVAELSGGKFANGALTAAMQHLFNAEAANIGRQIARLALYDGADKNPLYANGAHFKAAAERYGSGPESMALDAREGLDSAVEKLKAIGKSFDEVFIMDHGRPGAQELGNGYISAKSESLAALGKMIRPGGRIVFCGCSTASDSVGVAYIHQAAQTAGRHVRGLTSFVGYTLSGGIAPYEGKGTWVGASLVKK